MNDLKTSITGVVTAVVTLLSHFNIVIPSDYQVLIVAAGVLVASYFAKDAK